jgi:hypothetical protein
MNFNNFDFTGLVETKFGEILQKASGITKRHAVFL